jgi:hypothetical protein
MDNAPASGAGNPSSILGGGIFYMPANPIFVIKNVGFIRYLGF